MRQGLTRWRNTAIIKASLPRRLRRSGRSGQQSGRTPSGSGGVCQADAGRGAAVTRSIPFPPQTKNAMPQGVY